jgi:hypothetical protein
VLNGFLAVQPEVQRLKDRGLAVSIHATDQDDVSASIGLRKLEGLVLVALEVE